MKKFLKFLFATFSLIAAGIGIYYLITNVLNKKDEDEDFDDFEDDFEEFESEKEGNASESREYVPINLSNDSETTAEKSEAEASTEDVSETE